MNSVAFPELRGRAGPPQNILWSQQWHKNLAVGSEPPAVPKVLGTDPGEAVVLGQGGTTFQHAPSQSLSVANFWGHPQYQILTVPR